MMMSSSTVYPLASGWASARAKHVTYALSAVAVAAFGCLMFALTIGAKTAVATTAFYMALPVMAVLGGLAGGLAMHFFQTLNARTRTSATLRHLFMVLLLCPMLVVAILVFAAIWPAPNLAAQLQLTPFALLFTLSAMLGDPVGRLFFRRARVATCPDAAKAARARAVQDLIDSLPAGARLPYSGLYRNACAYASTDDIVAATVRMRTLQTLPQVRFSNTLRNLEADVLSTLKAHR